MALQDKHSITLYPSGLIFEGSSEKTLLDSALESGVTLEHSCKTGTCGVCEAQLISDDSSDSGEKVLTCQYKPSSSIRLKAEYYPELTEIECKTIPAKVNEIREQSENIMVLELRYPPKNTFKFLPGQYLDLKYQGISRSYSIASIPNNENTLELHFKKVNNGAMSEKIFAPISINQLVQIEGPKGTFFLRNKSTGPIIFVATGTGFAPVKAMLSQLIEEQRFDRPVYIYWGNRTSDLFYDQNLLLSWEDRYDFINVALCLSRSEDKWPGRKGYVQNCVLEDALVLENAEVYACGSIDMISAAKEQLVNAGLKSEHFYSDAFVAS